ncbi:MAG: antirestriction protein ArdA [Actinobacteria bacterium]|nr:antirestriction protein ArdA [Actinomycetota bacterium]
MNEYEPREHKEELGQPTPEQEPKEGPRIYVASLSDYNSGRLHGNWIDANQTAEELQEAINEMLRRSPEPGAEEWAIHDYDGFGPLRLGESDSMEYVARLAEGIAKYGLAFAAWADEVGNNPEALDQFEDVYFGAWESVEAYAHEVFDDLGYLAEFARSLPEHLRPYIEFDLEGFARDMVLAGDIVVVDNPAGGVWIFEGR